MNTPELTEQDIAIVIPRFYERVRADTQLGPIFASEISDWPGHLGKLVDFWSSVMLGSGRYKGQPVPAHLRHADMMTSENFDRWLTLWQEVTNETMPAAKANALQITAGRIAQSLRLASQYRPGAGVHSPDRPPPPDQADNGKPHHG